MTTNFFPVFALISSPVNLPIIVVAGLILAAVIFAAALLLFRSGNKKNAKAPAGSATNDWQPQVQQGAQGAWNPQQANNPWGQAGQAPAGTWGTPTGGQQPDQWGQQPATQQAGAPAGTWGTPTGGQQPDQWGQQPATQQAGAPAGTWGTPTGGQPGASGWGAQQSQAPANPWGQSNPLQPAANQQWGQQGTQDSWGQQPPAAQQPWAAQQPNQQAPTAYSGQNTAQPKGQPQSAEQWGAQTPANAASAAPQWQASLGQNGASVKPEAATAFANEGEKTMLRSAGSPPSTSTGAGTVRVEEGKEPGRTYEIRKEALSIGRSRESDIFLEDLAVSRLHASILNLGNGAYALRDEGSANGTKVNGQTVNKYQTYPLQEGDKIQLGQTVLVFVRH